MNSLLMKHENSDLYNIKNKLEHKNSKEYYFYGLKIGNYFN